MTKGEYGRPFNDIKGRLKPEGEKTKAKKREGADKSGVRGETCDQDFILNGSRGPRRSKLSDPETGRTMRDRLYQPRSASMSS